MADVDCERADLLIGLLGDPGDTGDDAALTPDERAEAEAHVASCPSCREALSAYRSLSGALRELPVEAPSAAGTARAYAAVVEAMAAGAASGPTLRVLEGGGGAARVQHAEPARRRPGLWLQGVAAAAGVLIVAALAFGPRAGDQARVARQDEAAPAAKKHERPVGADPAPPAAPAQGKAEQPAPAAEAPGSKPDGAGLAAPSADGVGGQAEGAERADAFTRAAEPAPADEADDADLALDAEREEKAANEAAAGEALGRADDQEARDAGAALESARGRAPSPTSPAAPAAPTRPQRAAEAELAGVIAAWRVGDRLVVLERAGDAVVAREASPALLDDALRARRAEPAPGAGSAPPPAPPAESSDQAAAQAEVEVEALPPAVAARLGGDAGRQGPTASTSGAGLDLHLRAILAAELRQPRDAAWSRRVTALLAALGDPPGDLAGDGATPDELAARARRHLGSASAAEDAPAGGR
jgi:hypothetical protein